MGKKYVLLLSPTVDYIATHSGDTREWVTDSHHIPFQVTNYDSEFAWLIDHEGTPQFTSWPWRDNYALTQRQIDRINSQFGFDLNEIKVAI
ncbi:hypothetical protein [Lentilactobacillus senioris]|uniref:hypothetical protein n=1 Tax=Lentilactobacillus senioris TaxID=931534 RepID=UPI0006CFB375|nr:hypothetical protein [Lentilactobacillus senioris]